MIYTDGTIAIKAGSPIVTGTGTQWKKNIHGVAPGQLISIENGAAPVSMMIRAVNSDTELVLSFNAPVTLSGAKYSIATTVPDTISDAARTMSANQGYIVYFLQAMQQWMTDTGKVEIELPNGQKVTLDSIKALNEAIKKIDEKVDNIKIPEIKDASKEQKGVIQLTDVTGLSETLVLDQKSVTKYLESKFNNNDLTGVIGDSEKKAVHQKGLKSIIGGLPLIGTGTRRVGETVNRQLGVTYINDSQSSMFVIVMLQTTNPNSNIITRMRVAGLPASNFYVGTKGTDAENLAEVTHAQLVLPGESYVITSSANSKIISCVEIKI